VRQAQELALLQAPQQEAHLNACRGAEWRRFDLAAEPYKRLVGLAHRTSDMSNMTWLVPVVNSKPNPAMEPTARVSFSESSN
jgi:hypothetical protein